MLQTTSQAPIVNSAVATTTRIATTGAVRRLRSGGRATGSRRARAACSGSRTSTASATAARNESAEPKTKML